MINKHGFLPFVTVGRDRVNIWIRPGEVLDAVSNGDGTCYITSEHIVSHMVTRWHVSGDVAEQLMAYLVTLKLENKTGDTQ